MLRDNRAAVIVLVICSFVLTPLTSVFAQDAEASAPQTDSAGDESEHEHSDEPGPTEDKPETGDEDEPKAPSEEEQDEQEQQDEYEGPPLPEGMTLDEVLDRAAKEPPDDYPDAVPDERIHAFLLGEQLEYRFDPTDEPDQVGLEMQGWLGGDYNRLWLKTEGEGVWQGVEGFEGETENDLLYSRLITPFWYVQAGAQYANEWTSNEYEDFWSGVLAFQGLAPGMFEIDASLYLSEDVDVTAEFEAEYDIRFTQRLVLQLRMELGFAFQDIPERDIGAGMTEAVVDLRLRYEIKREFAPYIGGRYQVRVGETGDRAEAAGDDPSRLLVVGGLRFALF